jgi:hypothetical protein
MWDPGLMKISCGMGHAYVIHADDLVSKRGESMRDRGIENEELVLWLMSWCVYIAEAAYMWSLLHWGSILLL